MGKCDAIGRINMKRLGQCRAGAALKWDNERARCQICPATAPCGWCGRHLAQAHPFAALTCRHGTSVPAASCPYAGALLAHHKFAATSRSATKPTNPHISALRTRAYRWNLWCPNHQSALTHNALKVSANQSTAIHTIHRTRIKNLLCCRVTPREEEY